MTWALGLIALFVVAGVAALAGLVFLDIQTERLIRIGFEFVGARAVALVIGVPLVLFAGWSLAGMPKRRTARDMTPAQVLIGIVVALLIGALGIALMIFAITTGPAPSDRSSF